MIDKIKFVFFLFVSVLRHKPDYDVYAKEFMQIRNFPEILFGELLLQHIK